MTDKKRTGDEGTAVERTAPRAAAEVRDRELPALQVIAEVREYELALEGGNRWYLTVHLLARAELDELRPWSAIEGES